MSSNSYISDNYKLDKYIDMFGGDKFAAIISVSKQARKLMKDSNCGLRDSQALSYVLSGKDVKMEKESNKNKINYELEDVLSTVFDNDVALDVRDSIHRSVQSKHLIYVCNHVKDNSRKSRVKILCNIIWDNMLK